MKINKLSIQSFGKFKNKTIELSDGLNVIYGENESGKTTLFSFVKYMLYGFHGRRSETNLISEDKYSPWDNSAITGSLEFSYDGNDYITTRSTGVRKEYITLNNTLGTKSFEAGSPGEEIYGIDENAFVRTYCLSSLTGVFSTVKNDDIIIRLSNMKATGDESVSCEKINAGLIKEKKKLTDSLSQKAAEISDLKGRLENISVLNNRLRILSSNLYDADNDLVTLRKTLNDTNKKNEEYEQLNKDYSSLRIYQIIKLLIFAFLLVISVVILFSPSFNPYFSLITLFACVIDFIMIVSSRIKIRHIEIKFKENDMDARIYSGDVISDIASKENNKINILKEMGAIESKLEQEYDYDDICSNIELLIEEKSLIEERLCIIEKAKSLLDISYEELKNVFVPELNKRASEIFSALSGNKYIDVLVTDTFEILVKNQDRYRSSQYFSSGMVELMYFSLRLALCELIANDKKLPVFLDDCFAQLDDKAVCTALDFLVKYAAEGRQILFSTCHGREFRYLTGFDSVNIITV